MENPRSEGDFPSPLSRDDPTRPCGHPSPKKQASRLTQRPVGIPCSFPSRKTGRPSGFQGLFRCRSLSRSYLCFTANYLYWVLIANQNLAINDQFRYIAQFKIHRARSRFELRSFFAFPFIYHKSRSISIRFIREKDF